jgi:hypothetical protein
MTATRSETDNRTHGNLDCGGCRESIPKIVSLRSMPATLKLLTNRLISTNPYLNRSSLIPNPDGHRLLSP